MTARAGTGLLESESHRGEEEGANTTRRRESWKNDEICKGRGRGRVWQATCLNLDRMCFNVVLVISCARKVERIRTRSASRLEGRTGGLQSPIESAVLCRFYPVPAGSGSLRSPPTEIARHCQYSHRGLGNFDKVFLSPSFGCLQHGNVFQCFSSRLHIFKSVLCREACVAREGEASREGGWGPGGNNTGASWILIAS